MATHSLRVLIDVPTSGLTRSLGAAGKGFKKLGGAAGAAGAIVGEQLVDQLKASVDAAREAEKAQARFEAQMKASGKSLEKHGGRIDAVIQKHSQLAGIDDEDLSDAFTNILRVTGSVNKSMDLLGVTMDIARAKNMDVAKAGELVGKVAGGNTGILSRYGIQIEKGATASEALAAMQERFAGQAKAYGETAAGAQERFQVAVENLQEKIGASLLPILTQVTGKVADFVGEMESGEGAGGRFADKVSEGFAKLKAVAETAWPVLRDAGKFSLELLRDGFDRLKVIIEAVTPTFLTVKDAAVVAFGAISGWIQQNRPQIESFATAVKDRVGAAFEAVKGAVGSVIGWLRENVPPAFNAVKDAISAAFETIKGVVSSAIGFITDWIGKHRDDIDAFGNAWKNIATGVGAAVGAIVLVVKEAFENVIAPVVKATMRIVLDAVERVWPTIKTIISGALRVIGGLINVFSGVFTGDWDRIWQGVKEIFSGAVRAIKGILKGLLSDIPAIAKDIGEAVIKGIGNGLKGLGSLVLRGIKAGLEWAYEKIKELPVVKQIIDLLSFGGGAKSGGASGNLIPNTDGDGLGKRVLANVKGKLGSGSIGTGVSALGGGLMGARPIMAPFAGAASRFGLRVVSGRRPGSITSSGNQSYHSTGEALDIAGAPAAMLGFFRYMKKTVGSRLAELIYTPGGAGIHNGASHVFSGQVAADHFDHVHLAVDSGAPGVGDGLGRFESTAYGPPWDAMNGTGVTATGVNLTPARKAYGVAVDPSVIPLGSKLKIRPNPFNYGGFFTAFDTGGAIKGNRIDFYDWRGRAKQLGWGRRSVSVSTGAGGSSGAAGGGKAKGKPARPGSVTVKPSGTGVDILPSYTQSSAPDAGVTAAQAFADRRTGGPVKGGGPTKGISQEEADARANAPAPPPPPSVQDYLDAEIAKAALTPGTEDDLAAANAVKSFTEEQYLAALAGGDPREITRTATAYKQATDAVDGLKGTIDQSNALAQQRLDLDRQIVANQAKILALANQGPQIVAAVVAAVSGGIGGQLGLGFQTPGYAGGLANYSGGGTGRL